MPIPLQIALTLGPLSTYFLILGAWQSGRDPKVVAGVIDFGLLIFGVGGLLAFGPIGGALIRLVFPGESVWAWLALPTSFALLALFWAPTTHRRVVVYNVDPEGLERALQEVIDELPGRFVATMRGYEDSKAAQGFWVHSSRRGRTGVIEAFGRHPDVLAATVAPLLRARLQGEGVRTSTVARVWFTLAALVLWLPILATLFGRDRVRAALRALLERLSGG